MPRKMHVKFMWIFTWNSRKDKLAWNSHEKCHVKFKFNELRREFHISRLCSFVTFQRNTFYNGDQMLFMRRSEHFHLLRFKVFPLIHFWFTFVLLFTTILSKGWNRPARLTWTWWGSRTHGTTWSLCKYLGFFCFLKKSHTSDTIFFLFVLFLIYS